MTIKKVLVPLDFSDRSRLALEHAEAVAKRFGSSLILQHVVPEIPQEYAVIDEGFAMPGASLPSERVQGRVEDLLGELITTVKPEADIETRICHGDPAGEIVAAANEADVDLVVMPTHGYGPFRRFALGSVTSKVLHDTDTPVMTGVHVPELSPLDPEPYKRIACAVDLDSHSEEVLWWADQFSKACADDLLVIHAAPAVEPLALYGEWVPPDTSRQVTARANQEVKRLLERVGCKGQLVVDAADPVNFIASAAAENYADLLVMGRTHKSGVFPGLRAHAGAIIRQAPCPVISI